MTIESWKTHVLNPKAPVDSVTLQETAAAIFELIANKKAYTINFLDLKPHSVNGEHLAMALRCTASRQKWITGWYVARERAKVTLQAEDKDFEDALYGLIDPKPGAAPALKYYWTITCLQGNAVVRRVVFSTDYPTTPSVDSVFSKLLAMGKVPHQCYPPMTHHIDAVGWAGDIPHLSES